VVFHPSWGYFADDYGLRQVAIEIEGKEPSDIEVTDIQEATREHEISVIYVQPQIAGKSARAIAGVLGARLETLDPLAPDIVANLRRTTEILAVGFHG
jgi:zinc transport system substrate-binding protein